MFKKVCIALYFALAGFCLFEAFSLGIFPVKTVLFAALGPALYGIVLLLVRKWKVLVAVLSVLGMAASLFCGSLLLGIHETIYAVTEDDQEQVLDLSVWKLKDNMDIIDQDDMDGLTVGIFKQEAPYLIKKGLDAFTQSGLEMKVKEYYSLPDLVKALYEEKVPMMLASNSEMKRLVESARQDQSDQELADFFQKTESVYETSYSYYQEKSVIPVDTATDPYQVLVLFSGEDADPEDEEPENSFFVLTVNPTERELLITALPSSLSIKMACDAVNACPAGQAERLGYTSLYGTNTTRRTIEKLFGIKINYVAEMGYAEIEDIQGKTAVSQLASNNQKSQIAAITALLHNLTDSSFYIKHPMGLKALYTGLRTDMEKDQLETIVKNDIVNQTGWTVKTTAVTGVGEEIYSASTGTNLLVLHPEGKDIAEVRKQMETTMGDTE